MASHQNYYPDVTCIKRDNPDLKFALDFKTTYRREDNTDFCNGFTLGSHGAYFTDRNSTKNIQFPYREYAGHFCLGVIYSRLLNSNLDDMSVFRLEDLRGITSVIGNLEFFAQEKWRIASDKRGSGNTANIGSITRISDIVGGTGMFSLLGEGWFDDYWSNYSKIRVRDSTGQMKPITNLVDFVQYRKGDTSLIVPKASPGREK